MKSNYICFSHLKSTNIQEKHFNHWTEKLDIMPFIEIIKIKYLKRITPQATLPTFSYSFLDNVPKSDTKITWTSRKIYRITFQIFLK